MEIPLSQRRIQVWKPSAQETKFCKELATYDVQSSPVVFGSLSRWYNCTHILFPGVGKRKDPHESDVYVVSRLSWCFLLLNFQNQLPCLPILCCLWPDCQLLHVPANLRTSKEVCPKQEIEAKNVLRLLEHFVKLRLASPWHRSAASLEEWRVHVMSSLTLSAVGIPWFAAAVTTITVTADTEHTQELKTGSSLDCHSLACHVAESSSLLAICQGHRVQNYVKCNAILGKPWTSEFLSCS